MLYTIAHRAALIEAIASGATRVSVEGKSVEYRSLDEMKRTLSDIDESLKDQLGLPRARRQLRVMTFADKAL